MKTKRMKVPPAHYLKAYRLAREGASDAAIAKGLGVSVGTLAARVRGDADLAGAISEGRGESAGAESFRDFMHGRLTPKAQALWDELEAAEAGLSSDDGRVRLEAAVRTIADQGRRMRQRLFLHAMMCSNFQVTAAARRVGVPMQEVKDWLKRRDFAALIRDVQRCKKDFFEAALIELVRNGDSAATIFVNKTVNRDRGYGDAPKGEVNKHEHVHRLILDDLPVDVKRAVLDSIRRKQIEYKDSVIDAGVVDK